MRLVQPTAKLRYTWTLLRADNTAGARSMFVAQVVGCSTDSTSSLKAALQDKQEQGPHLVVWCTQPPAPGLQGSAEAVAAELRQVQQAHDEVAQLRAKRQLTMYAAIPDEALPAQRQLLGVQADVGSCGQLCQVRAPVQGKQALVAPAAPFVGTNTLKTLTRCAAAGQPCGF